MARTLRHILDAQAEALAGRERELAALETLLAGERPLVVFAHGVAGVGKSTLLRAFASRARAAGAAVVQLDGGAVEPTERGFLAALSGALGAPSGGLDAVAGRLGELAGRTVLAVDTLERLRLLDEWLRRGLLPALPASVRVVLAGRDPPAPGWAAAFGDLLADLPLGNLAREDAELLLRRAGVGAATARQVNRLAHGHPLSLRLAASALAARPGLDVARVAVPAVVDGWAALYLDGLDRLTRDALDAAAVVRRPTRSLLAAMLPEQDAGDAWALLGALPFTRTGPDGLVVHDSVREATDAALRAADPERRRRLRRAALAQLRAELAEAGSGELWRYTADLLFLVDDPLVRDGFFPAGAAPPAVERASHADEAAVLNLAGRFEGPEGQAIVGRWWRAAPEGFRVARDAAGAVAGFLLLCEPSAVGARVIAQDPVAAAWREDLRRRSLPPDQVALFGRAFLTHDGDTGRNDAQAALWIDAKRVYLELRPRLRRVYMAVRRPELVEPLLAPLGFEPLPGPPVAVDGTAVHSLVLDFGPGSVDGWLARLAAAGLAPAAGPRLNAERRELVIDGRRVALTQLELSLLAHLRERDGRTVPRQELLREVWGHRWSGDGNVIEAAVSALRRKLGEDAALIETVRGIGYRWRSF